MKRQIGTLVLKEPKKFTQHYECAAWYKEVEVAAGSYPVWGTFEDGSLKHYGAEMQGTVTSSNFSSLYCGSVITSKIDEEKGLPGTAHIDGSYRGYQLAHDILEGKSAIVLTPEYEARWIDFVSMVDNKPCRTSGIFEKTVVVA